jgi:hypothetical protein
MTYEVHINTESDLLYRTLKFAVVDRHAHAITLVCPDGTSIYHGEDGKELPENYNYWWVIPADAAHALLAAFSRHLGAVEHPQQLRRDYEAERKRVDKFIDSMIQDAP